MKDKEEKAKEKLLSQYHIDIVALQHKTYQYAWVCNKDFFACFENSLFATGSCEIGLTLTKSETMLTVVFDIKGTIELVCDRSLEVFDFPIHVLTTIFFKFGEKAAELSEDVVVIPRNIATLELENYLYELVSLEVPMKKLHPKFAGEESSEGEEEILIYKSVSQEETIDDKVLIDPRWANLKKLL